MRQTTVTTVDKKKSSKGVVQSAATVVKFFVFVSGARPTSGGRLAAHTDAALRFLGLAEQRTVRKNAALAVMGARAIDYHIKQGNLLEQGEYVKLTPAGYTHFKARAESASMDGKLAAAFLLAITKGKVSPEHGIQANHIIPVGMQLH